MKMNSKPLFKLKELEEVPMRKKEIYEPIFQGKRLIKRQNEIPLRYIWHLYHYDGLHSDNGMIFFYDLSLLEDENKIDKLASQEIMDTLNNYQCFDFQYTPKEKDFINISKNILGAHCLTFAFEKGKWKLQPFDNDFRTSKLINKGELIFFHSQK
ncbi:hypothetical protein [Capnocytophaga canimorsus]|uniref:hypothetical protein n=1 Tax=Capnocytophaga canimorsus TaxID=28188 RepID=UPI001EE01338|nr:hypothetical protein [Capnocytophaga canimorsus]GJQ05724.1 hypothetical protein CAPN009_21390 [Capnocytophaga canimorsus]